MPFEIEVKYIEADHAALRQRLDELGARRLFRGFESNVVYDDASRRLRSAGILLRLRETRGLCILTLKRDTGDSAAKICEETETEVRDAAAMRGILTGLGYSPSLRYEKVRESWTLAGCEVCLDTLPFGNFMEIEGPGTAIAACAATLKLPQDKASTATYHDLNRQYRVRAGLPPDDSFVFAEADRAALLAGCDAG